MWRLLSIFFQMNWPLSQLTMYMVRLRSVFDSQVEIFILTLELTRTVCMCYIYKSLLQTHEKDFLSHFKEKETNSRGCGLLGEVHIDWSRRAWFQTKIFRFVFSCSLLSRKGNSSNHCQPLTQIPLDLAIRELLRSEHRTRKSSWREELDMAVT